MIVGRERVSPIKFVDVAVQMGVLCHGTFGDRSPYLAQADQYANTDHYAEVDPRWRRKDRIDEYYYLIGINECYGDGLYV